MNGTDSKPPRTPERAARLPGREGQGEGFVPLAMPDADVSWLRSAELCAAAPELIRALIASTPWRQQQIRIYGKTHAQPRLIAWYGDDGASYTYSRLKLEPLPWTPTLEAIRARIEHLTDSTFNSVLVNYYRDHRDSMGLHSDDEPELGPRPIIASLSLGESRELIFRHRYRREVGPVKLPLESGDLLLMKGETQRHWKHGIDKRRRPCGARVNLTFRTIIQTTSPKPHDDSSRRLGRPAAPAATS